MEWNKLLSTKRPGNKAEKPKYLDHSTIDAFDDEMLENLFVELQEDEDNEDNE